MIDAQQYLEQVQMLNERIAALKAERRDIFDKATDMGSTMPDGIPHSFTGNISRKVEAGGVNLAQKSAELDKTIARYIEVRQQIHMIICQLPPRQYGALRRHFLDGMSWEMAAEDMGISVRSVYRLRKKALKNLRGVIVCHGGHDV